jgi:hypothetical protein
MDLHVGEESLGPTPEHTLSDKSHIFSSRTLSIGERRPSSSTDKILPPPAPSSTRERFTAQQVPQNPASKHFLPPGTLGELASVLRSKNAGPFEITFDVMFDSEEEYSIVKQSGILSPKTAADTLGLSEENIIWCGFFDPARAFKVTIPRMLEGRRVDCGSFMEKDVHAAQQYLPLMYMKLPQELLDKLGR